MQLIAKLIFHVTAVPYTPACWGESDHSHLPQCFLIFQAVPPLLLSHLSAPPLPYITTSNLICIVIALVNSTIWLWSSSDSLCLGCIKSFDADTERLRACLLACLPVLGQRTSHAGSVLMLPFCFHLISLLWFVQVWLFISPQNPEAQPDENPNP